MTHDLQNSATLSPLKRALLAIAELQAKLARAENRHHEPVAIVGLACRFPGGAETPEAYWQLLASGRDAVGAIPPERWPAEAFFSANPAVPGKMCSMHGGYLGDIEGFDPAFFGISPREAASMDPQHRLLLEVGWEALMSAGQLGDRLAGRPTGVFVGVTSCEHGQMQLGAEGLGALDAYHLTGNALNAAAGRLAFVFGLHGPCMAVDTACSSSLVAVHLAAASLRAGECDAALAGGVNAILSPFGSIALSQGRVLSPTGRTQAFAAGADGMVRGEGCGLLVLKRLRDAERDGDRILAVIRGSGVNQDGPSSGLTVPNGPAQEALLRRVLADAGVAPHDVDAIEAHGTGTALGDPIEAGALGAVFGPGRPADQPLWLGSVKTNLGHLESAAGVASLIKMVLALHHGAIPPHLHFERPSPHIPWDRLPLQVPVTLTPWPRGPRRRLAGISAFGFSGTNAHLLLEEAPAAAAQDATITVPASPWRRERFPLPRLVIPGEADAGVAVHPLLGSAVGLAGTDERRFEARLSAAAPAFLADHRVFDVAVFPASAFLEIAVGAAREVFASAAVAVQDLTLRQALAFAAGTTRVVQTVVDPAGEVRIFSHAADDTGAWTLHATARIVRGGVLAPDAAAVTGEPVRVAPDELYARYRARGLDYGPAFRAMGPIDVRSGSAEVALQLPAGVSSAGFAVHPALLDACFQAAGAVVEADEAVYLPVSVRRWTVGASAGTASRARIVSRRDGAEVEIDVVLLDATGAAVGRLEGLALQRASREALRRAIQGTDDGLLYEIQWQPAPLPVPTESSLAGGDWLILPDRGGRGGRVAVEMTARGAVVTCAGADDWEVLLRADRDWRGVVDLRGLDLKPDEIDPVVSCGPALLLVQRLIAVGRSTQLWVVTHGAVEAENDSVNPAAAALWGFGRVVMAEHPELACRLVDLEGGADDVANILTECIGHDAENQVAWRGGARRAARLGRREPAGPAELPALDPAAAYLITGGLGALGRLTADWLVRRGARHLVLTGRSEASAAAAAQIAAWRGQGVAVTVHRADMGRRSDVAELLAGLKAPLRGVVHAAGVLADATVRQQSPALFARVFAPKVAGAWHLHELTRDQPLDFFVMFSSAAALLGTPGQANYAAANAALDALALHRRSEGRAALSVNWGPWLAGMAAGVGEQHAARGVRSITPLEGFGALESLLAGGATCALVMSADWRRFAEALGSTRMPLVSGLLPRTGAVPVAGPTAEEFDARLAALDAAGRHQLVAQFVSDEAARVLRVTAERALAAPSLQALGLDSLMAVELRNRVRAIIGAELPVSVYLDGATVTGLAAAIVGRLAAPGSNAVALPGASRVVDVSSPLSAGQEALWFLHETAPESPAYHTAFTLRLRGSLDTPALRRAVEQLVARHPALRASFPAVEGGPVMKIHGELRWNFAETDATTDGGEEFAQRVATDYARPFDVAGGPLGRVTLFRRGPADFVLLCTIHHLVSDAWTNWVLLDELRRLYVAGRTGQPAALAPLTAGYADFVREQRALTAGPEGERLAAYWRGQLAGELPVLALPTDLPRPAVLVPRGAAVPLELSPELFRRVRALAQVRGTTPFNVFLAAFQVLLHRYTGQEDLVVGTPTAGRQRAAFEGVAGYFVNPVPLRARVAGRQAFTTLLEQARRTTLDALEHAALPLPALVGLLNLPRDPSRTPLFQTLFVYQQPPAAAGEGAARSAWDGLEVSEFPLVQMAGQFELLLEIFEGAGASLKFHTALFTVETARRLALSYRRLLEAILAAPDTTVAALPLLDQAEHELVVRRWNDTPADYPQDLCLHERIAQQVLLSPDAPAVSFEETTLTYRELDAKANQLAHWLRRAGVGPDVPVGVCAERSLELVIALLAVLKAGGAYVPFDPAYPAERLAFMREDSVVGVVLTQAAFAASWADSGARVLALDTGWSEVAAEPVTAPATGVTPDHLAYVIYTSGSTGRPKGAANTHRAIVNRLLWMQDAYRLTPADIVLQKTPFSFDVSVWEFFWPLLTGARLVVARPGAHQDARQLAELTARAGVTTMHFVPSMLQAFVEEPGLAECSALRQVFCSGEALPRELAERFLARHGAQLHNLYGPTEAAVDVTFWPCRRDDPQPRVPIGRPIARTQMFVLDDRFQPVPVGVIGELYIGGTGLARGYHRRPDLTAERFVPNPFGAPGSRLYRTGDRARWLPEGVLDYQGRVDHQVKIRGVRIELGEIETALAGQPGVREAVALVREDQPGNPQLVAYFTTETPAPEIAGLRRALRAILPAALVPADLVPLPALPLSPNGKVDRRALPAPSRLRPEQAAALVPPATDTERKLAELWCEILDRDQVGVLDNFFDLGGHSLKLGRVHARLATLVTAVPPLVELFQYPTIRALAARLDGLPVAAVSDAGAERAATRSDRRDGLRRDRTQRQQAREIRALEPQP